MCNSVHEDFLHAAVTGNVDELERMISAHTIPQDLRDRAHRIALKGGHSEAGRVLKPVFH